MTRWMLAATCIFIAVRRWTLSNIVYVGSYMHIHSSEEVDRLKTTIMLATLYEIVSTQGVVLCIKIIFFALIRDL